MINKIANRAILILGDGDKLSIEMDISACHSSGCKLDLVKLLWDFDDLNFIHDVTGIAVNLDRSTGKLLNCFHPRSAAGNGKEVVQ